MTERLKLMLNLGDDFDDSFYKFFDDYMKFFFFVKGFDDKFFENYNYFVKKKLKLIKIVL